MRLSWIVLFCALAGGPLLMASTNEVRVVSRSGQFVFYGATPFGSAAAYRFQGRNQSRPIEPGTAAIAAEKIRQAFHSSFHLRNLYSGRIQVVLAPTLAPDHLTTLISTRYPEGWQYELTIPARAREFKFLRAITQVLLLELANRNATLRSAEIPTWLAEGLSLELQRILGEGFTFRSDITVARDIVQTDGFESLREYLGNHQALSFEELALSAPSEADLEKFTLYRASAQCFTHELLSLTNGLPRMVAFIQTLPQYWNWQTAFFQVYQPLFPNMLAVEKWWSLAALNFPRNPNRLGPGAQGAIDRLDALLRMPGEILLSSNALPVRAELTLQQILKGVPFAQQQDILNVRLTQLTLLELQSAGEFAKLVGGYRSLLTHYLDRRSEGGGSRGRIGPSTPLLVSQAIRQLDLLDQSRDAMRMSNKLTSNP